MWESVPSKHDDNDDDDDDDGDDDDDANNALFRPVPTFVGESESEEMLRFVFTLIARAVTRKESQEEEVVQTKYGR